MRLTRAQQQAVMRATRKKAARTVRGLAKADLVCLAVEDWCRRHGLPAPIREHVFAMQLGRRWRFDLCWPAAGQAAGIAVEIQGGSWCGGRHTRAKGFAEDRVKINTAQLLGWRVFEVTHSQCEAGYLFELLAAALLPKEAK